MPRVHAGRGRPRALAILRSMTPVHPVRHLLRAKDLIDARYREPLDVPALARVAHLSPPTSAVSSAGRSARRRTSTSSPAGWSARQHCYATPTTR